jgi:hypothetical protein
MQWRDAESLDEQNAIFRNCGIRWSPLLQLPYWNPIIFTAIEPMHVFDARLFQNHCRQVWGIDTSNLGGDGTVLLTAKVIARPPDAELESGMRLYMQLKIQSVFGTNLIEGTAPVTC